MKFILTTLTILLLLPLFAGAMGGPITITSPSDGFVITGEEDTIPVGGTIIKGFWDSQILKLGGQMTASVSAGDKQISQIVEYVFPSLHPTGKYSYGIAFDANALRGETEISLTVRVEAKNSKGVVIAYAETYGMLEPRAPDALTVTLASITPPSVSYERGSIMNPFTAISFAAERENVSIQSLTLTRSGGNDSDLLNILLFDGSTRVGMSSSVINRFQDGKITILLDSPFVIPEGETKILMIRADVDSDASAYSIENGIAIGIANSSDIQAIGMKTGNIIVPANFQPIFGNPMGIQ